MVPSHQVEPEAKGFPSNHTTIDHNGVTAFYNEDLDRVQRRLNGIHVQMYVHPRLFCEGLLRSLHNQVRCEFFTCLKPGTSNLQRALDRRCYWDWPFLRLRPASSNDRAIGCASSFLARRKCGFRVRPVHLRLIAI
jgi:hypothetical protein